MATDIERAFEMVSLLSTEDRQRLLQVLSPRQTRIDLPLMQSTGAPSPQSSDWIKAERGHAVLATYDVPDEAIPAGAAAIAGIWSRADAGQPSRGDAPNLGSYRGPALIATDVCLDLGCGLPAAVELFRTGSVEVRLATATYLELLATSSGSAQRRRVQRFVSSFAVLSLGPMASSRSVELMLEQGGSGLEPLEALAAATALAHEIPIITRRTDHFEGIEDLEVLVPYA